jgi:hypothetical protein
VNRTTLVSLLLLLALDGCAASAYTAEVHSAPHEPEGSVDDYAARITRLQGKLDDELRTDRAPSVRPEHRPSIGEPGSDSGLPPRHQPDCRAAPELRDRICELAQRICAIADRDPNDHTLAQTCVNAREACDQATLRVGHACSD